MRSHRGWLPNKPLRMSDMGVEKHCHDNPGKAGALGVERTCLEVSIITTNKTKGVRGSQWEE